MDLKAELAQCLIALQQNETYATAENLTIVAQMLQDNDAGWLREENAALHMSASALVFQENRCFFVYHPYLKQWLLPAGHVEQGETPLMTAQREFFEETGYVGTPIFPYPIDVNLFQIPANPLKNEPAHVHVDFRFALQASVEQVQQAELATALLTQAEALDEYQKYFQNKKADS